MQDTLRSTLILALITSVSLAPTSCQFSTGNEGQQTNESSKIKTPTWSAEITGLNGGQSHAPSRSQEQSFTRQPSDWPLDEQQSTMNNMATGMPLIGNEPVIGQLGQPLTPADHQSHTPSLDSPHQFPGGLLQPTSQNWYPASTLERVDTLATNEPHPNYLLLNSPSPLRRAASLLALRQIAQGAGQDSQPSIEQQQQQQALRQLLRWLPLIYRPALPFRGPLTRGTVSRRRGSESLLTAEGAKVPRVNFDEPAGGEPLDLSQAPQAKVSAPRAGARSPGEYLAHPLANLPWLLDPSYGNSLLQPTKSLRFVDEDPDALVASGAKLAAAAAHQPPGQLLGAASWLAHPSWAISQTAALGPAPASKHSQLSRRGIDKSLGVPILVGIGAGLISFLIVSNLFLSIPLLAMTVAQLLNGSNGLLIPNNSIPGNQSYGPVPSNGQPRQQQQQSPQETTRTRRQARDSSSLFEQRANRILRAIEKVGKAY